MVIMWLFPNGYVITIELTNVLNSIGFIFADGTVEKTLAIIPMHLLRCAGFLAHAILS